MPIRWYLDDSSDVIASWAQGRVTPNEIYTFLDAAERRIAGSPIRAHLHVSDDASPDLLRVAELTGVASRIRAVMAVIPKPWFKNAIISGSAVQYGVTRMVLGLVGTNVPCEVFRDVASAANWLGLDAAEAQAIINRLRPDLSHGAA
jgi:hypothetical protein